MSNKDNQPDAIVEFGALLIKGLVALIFIGLMLLITLSISLGRLGDRLKDDGLDGPGIFKRKLIFIAGLLPLGIIFALVAGNLNIDYRTNSNILSPKKTQAVLREEISDQQDKYESVANDIQFSKNQLKFAIDDRKDLNRELRNAETIEDQSLYEEKLAQNKQEIADLKEKIAELTASLPNEKRKLEEARSDLESLRDGRPKRYLRVRETYLTGWDKAQIYGKWMLYTFGYLILSLLLSSIAMTMLPDNKRFEAFCNGAFHVWGFVSKLGLLPFKYLIAFFDVDVGKKEDTTPKVMKLGAESKAYLTDRNLNYHVQIIGGSGAGKTNLLQIMIEDRVKRGHSLLFFDFKADIELMDWITGLAAAAGRREQLQMISMSDSTISHAYNPISTGNESEISSQIMNSLNWSETYYRDTAESGLMIILKVLCFIRDLNHRPFHLGHVYFFLTNPSYRMDMIAEASRLMYPEIYRADLRRISEELSTNKKDNYHGLISQLSKVLNSAAGPIISTKTENEQEFDFREAIEKGKIAYLFMNSLKLKETASIIGKMMLQDLMKVVGNIYDDRNYIKRPTTLIIDEFASFAIPDFGEFIEKARGAGLSIVVAYQSRKSLDHIEQNLALKINENTATKIVFQVQDSEDAEWFCGLVGTKTVEKETYQAEEGILFGNSRTGMKSIRQTEEFVVHPNVLKRLQTGQALLVCNKVDPHHIVMNIKRANYYSQQYTRKIELKNKHRPSQSTLRPAITTQNPKQEEIRPEDLI
jgi:type IV secretory pathway TraG/TraD family ATPase VirD4